MLISGAHNLRLGFPKQKQFAAIDVCIIKRRLSQHGSTQYGLQTEATANYVAMNISPRTTVFEKLRHSESASESHYIRLVGGNPWILHIQYHTLFDFLNIGEQEHSTSVDLQPNNLYKYINHQQISSRYLSHYPIWCLLTKFSEIPKLQKCEVNAWGIISHCN